MSLWKYQDKTNFCLKSVKFQIYFSWSETQLISKMRPRESILSSERNHLLICLTFKVRLYEKEKNRTNIENQ